MFWSTLFNLTMALLKLVAAICVSPQVNDSKMASWMNVNCSYGNIIRSRHWTATETDSCTHVSLDHLHSLMSDLGDGSRDVHQLLFLYLLKNVIYHNKCTCATHTSAARDRGERRVDL